MTPDGIQPGIQKGLMRGDETIIDTVTGESSIPSGANPNIVGTAKDTVPVGEPGSFDGGGIFDRSSILGSRRDLSNPYGLTFQQQAWGPAKIREMLKTDSAIKKLQAAATEQQFNQEKENNRMHKTRDNNTKKVVDRQIKMLFGNRMQSIQNDLQKNAQADAKIEQYLMTLADKQDVQYGDTADENGQILANCGKSPRYAWGKSIVGPALGLAATLPYLIRESNWVSRNQPTKQYEFVSNPNASAAIDTLSKLRYDNSADMLDTIRAERRGLYGINQAGNLSTGQRRALANDFMNQSFARRAAIRQQAQELNNRYAAAAAQASLQEGQNYAQRLQQARHNQNEAYARAVGAQQQLWAANNKNWYTGLMSNIRDWDTAIYRNRLLNMYDADIRAKAAPRVIGNSGIEVIEKPADTIIPSHNYNLFNPITGTVRRQPILSPESNQIADPATDFYPSVPSSLVFLPRRASL